MILALHRSSVRSASPALSIAPLRSWFGGGRCSRLSHLRSRPRCHHRRRNTVTGLTACTLGPVFSRSRRGAFFGGAVVACRRCDGRRAALDVSAERAALALLVAADRVDVPLAVLCRGVRRGGAPGVHRLLRSCRKPGGIVVVVQLPWASFRRSCWVSPDRRSGERWRQESSARRVRRDDVLAARAGLLGLAFLVFVVGVPVAVTVGLETLAELLTPTCARRCERHLARYADQRAQTAAALDHAYPQRRDRLRAWRRAFCAAQPKRDPSVVQGRVTRPPAQLAAWSPRSRRRRRSRARWRPASRIRRQCLPVGDIVRRRDAVRLIVADDLQRDAPRAQGRPDQVGFAPGGSRRPPRRGGSAASGADRALSPIECLGHRATPQIEQHRHGARVEPARLGTVQRGDVHVGGVRSGAVCTSP